MSNPFQAAVAGVYKAAELMIQAQFLAKSGEHIDKVKPLFNEAKDLVDEAIKIGETIKYSDSAILFLQSNTGMRNIYKQQEESVAAYITAFEENEPKK